MSVRELTRRFVNLPIGLIDAPANPSRGSMDEEKLDELTRNIREIGLQQPIIVCGKEDRYEVIAGHRRRIACERAGLVEVPCIVYPNKQDALFAVQHAENRFREDLNVADEAIWFRELLEDFCGGDVDRVCGIVGEKRSYVENRLALILGDEKIFEVLSNGKITIGVAHELNKITDEQMRRYYLACAARDGATVAVVVGWVAQWRATVVPEGVTPPAPYVPSAAVAAEAYDPHRCYVCGKSHPQHIPELVPIHQHCKLAILDPLLAGDVPSGGK